MKKIALTVALVMSLIFMMFVSTKNVFAQIAPYIAGAQKIQKEKLDEVINRLASLKCFDDCRPHSRFKKKHQPISRLEGKFQIEIIDPYSVSRLVQYSVNIYQDNKTGEVDSLTCTVLNNNLWTDIVYGLVTDTLRAVSYCLNEPFDIVGLVPWKFQDFMHKFGEIGGVDPLHLPDYVWAREMDYIPNPIIKQLEAISLNWAPGTKQIVLTD